MTEQLLPAVLQSDRVTVRTGPAITPPSVDPRIQPTRTDSQRQTRANRCPSRSWARGTPVVTTGAGRITAAQRRLSVAPRPSIHATLPRGPTWWGDVYARVLCRVSALAVDLAREVLDTSDKNLIYVTGDRAACWKNRGLDAARDDHRAVYLPPPAYLDDAVPFPDELTSPAPPGPTAVQPPG